MSGGRDESRTDIEVSPPHDGGATTPILGGRYALEELLGSGGMGRVYRARDLKLGRAVAIKLVNCATADRRQRARLEREARAAGALNHPNIVAVHDVGEDDGEPYVVSELLEGETLRTRLERGPLPRELALDLGIQLASGVAAAHRHGIVHRDLKPENLFVTREGHLKILDFGIAKPIGAAAEDDGMQTDRSYVVGTPKYMSPEQVKGEPADARSDVFACGAVLQEMLTGTPPFGRAGTIETAYAVLHDAPPPLPDSRFSRVVARCLSKSPESRHSSGAELLDDLRRLARDAPVGRSWISRRTTAAVSLAMVLAAAIALVVEQPWSRAPIRIAVADFTNETAERDLDSLSGMLMTSLEQSRHLAVLSRAGMLDSLRRLNKPLAARIDESAGAGVAREVGAKALVVAHVRRFGDLYAIDLKLLDPTGNRYLFGALEQGLGKESVPAIIDRLSERVRSGLHEDAADIKSTSRPVALSTTASLEAYRHFFAAEDLWLRSIEVKKAFEEYQRAIALDPEFALAHLRLARNSDEGDAKDHLDRALQLTGRLSDTDLCRARALHSMFEGREQQALSTLQDCAARYPTDESTVEETGDWAFHQGRFDIADQYLGRVLANHPMHAEAYNHQVFIWFVRGEIPRILAAASAQLKQSHDLETYEHFVWSQWIAGKSDVAEATVGEMERLFPGEWGPLRIRQLLSLHAGDTEKAEALLARPEFATLDRAEQDYVRLVIDWSRGRFRHAFTVFDEMSRAFPDYGPALILWKARALAARGDRDGARRLAADVLPAEARQVKTNPAYRRQFIAKVLHGLLCWLGEADEALAMVEGQQIPAAQHSDLATRLDAARARKEGRLADEIAAYEKLVAGDPVWRPTMLMRLGVLYLDAHQHRKAVDALRSGLSSMSVVRQRFRYAPPSPVDPEFVFNWYRLAKALEGAGDRIAALDAYRRVLRMWSDADADAPELIETRLRVAELENAR